MFVNYINPKLKISITTLVILIACSNFNSAVANPVTISKLKLEAKNAYNAGKYQQALSLWNKLVQRKDLQANLQADIYSHLAALYRQIGQPGKAIASWQSASAIYRHSKNPHLLAAVLIDQAQTHNSLRQPDFSLPLLEEAIEIANQENLTAEGGQTQALPFQGRERLTQILAIGHQALGNAFSIMGDFDQASENYSKSLAAAENLDNQKLSVVALNNLSNLYARQHRHLQSQAKSAQESGSIEAAVLRHQSLAMAKKAWHHALRATRQSKSSQTLFSAEAILQLVELSKAYSESQIIEPLPVKNYLQQAHKTLLSLPSSQRKAMALIDLANLQSNPVSSLELALEVSQGIGYLPAQSLALGYLGTYYEQQQDYELALTLTYQAQQAAQQINAANLLYRWNWQAGRVHHQLGQNEDAILAYQQAIASLQSIRSNLAQANDLQIDFRLEIEPVYRQLIKLLLTKNPSKAKIRQALEIKDLLQLSELEYFFGDHCIITKTAREQVNSPKTTVINTIILEENSYLILELPNGKVKSYSLPVSAHQVHTMVKQWRYDLENQENDRYLILSRKLYQLLIKPIEAELSASKTEQLVFVNDGILRNVPMAALQDGEKFLLEKYALANSLGFDLKFLEPEKPQVNVLAFGLTSDFSESQDLPYVEEELDNITKITEGKSFLDEQFNLDNFVKETEKEQYNVIHIATHAQFTGTKEQTYIETYEEKISLSQLEQILNQREPDSRIQLLTLSACETAAGSERAILGLAGVAIRSNVDNVLGSLWNVSDREMVSFTSDFYRYWLSDELTKPEALRQAQINLINQPNFHPALWSSLILIER